MLSVLVSRTWEVRLVEVFTQALLALPEARELFMLPDRLQQKYGLVEEERVVEEEG